MVGGGTITAAFKQNIFHGIFCMVGADRHSTIPTFAFDSIIKYMFFRIERYKKRTT